MSEWAWNGAFNNNPVWDWLRRQNQPQETPTNTPTPSLSDRTYVQRVFLTDTQLRQIAPSYLRECAFLSTESPHVLEVIYEVVSDPVYGVRYIKVPWSMHPRVSAVSTNGTYWIEFRKEREIEAPATTDFLYICSRAEGDVFASRNTGQLYMQTSPNYFPAISSITASPYETSVSDNATWTNRSTISWTPLETGQSLMDEIDELKKRVTALEKQPWFVQKKQNPANPFGSAGPAPVEEKIPPT